MENFDAAKAMQIVKALLDILNALLVYFGAIEEGEDPAYQKYLDAVLGLIETASNAVAEEE